MLQSSYTLSNVFVCVQAPFICDYQTASYMLTIQATTGVELQPPIRQSVYTGWNRSVVEVITTGLQINYNYTLTITVVEEDLDVEVSTAVNFSMFYGNSHKFLIMAQ